MNQKIREFRKQSIINYLKKNMKKLELTAEPIAIGYERWMKVYDGIPCTYSRFERLYKLVKEEIK